MEDVHEEEYHHYYDHDDDENDMMDDGGFDDEGYYPHHESTTSTAAGGGDGWTTTTMNDLGYEDGSSNYYHTDQQQFSSNDDDFIDLSFDDDDNHHPEQNVQYQRLYFLDDDKISWSRSVIKRVRKILFPWYEERNNYDDYYSNDTTNNNKNGIWIAVLAILIYQFWPEIQYTWNSIQSIGVYETSIDIVARLKFRIRAYLQSDYIRYIQQFATNITRIPRMLLGQDTHFEGRHYLSSFPFTGSGSLQEQQGGGGRVNLGGDGTFRSLWGMDTSASNSSSGFFFSSSEETSAPPPLVIRTSTPSGEQKWEEIDDGDKESSNDSQTTSIQKTVGGRTDFPLEPSFVDQKSCPPDWLVYHPLLGVVSQLQADEYDRNRKNVNGRRTTGSRKEYAAPITNATDGNQHGMDDTTRTPTFDDEEKKESDVGNSMERRVLHEDDNGRRNNGQRSLECDTGRTAQQPRLAEVENRSTNHGPKAKTRDEDCSNPTPLTIPGVSSLPVVAATGD